MEKIVSAFAAAKKRLLLLDYDGTLVEYAPTPERAAPSEEVIHLLTMLMSDTRNTVVLISGRPPETLDRWFGDTGVDAAAEHGHFVKRSGHWRRTTTENNDWKPMVKKHMSAAAGDVSGSFIEEKGTSLVWHYRQAHPAVAQKIVEELMQTLTTIPGVHVSHGAKIVEARQSGADKGMVASNWLNGHSYDFILAAGDDTTDEDLFAALPKTAYTIKIGDQSTVARIHLSSPKDFLILLQKMAS